VDRQVRGELHGVYSLLCARAIQRKIQSPPSTPPAPIVHLLFSEHHKTPGSDLQSPMPSAIQSLKQARSASIMSGNDMNGNGSAHKLEDIDEETLNSGAEG